MKTALIGTFIVIICTFEAFCDAVPLVAVHDSELTRALESMPAVSPTPAGPGTTGQQWWPANWNYFVMPETLQEMLRSDGTPFDVVGDADIISGVLTNSDGTPRYPILISLASEAIDEEEVAALTNYVAAGGFLLVGSSAFTRHTSGASRGDFAIADEMGVHMVSPGLTNWSTNNSFFKQVNHRIVNHIPNGQLTWRLASSAEEISWGISPAHPFLLPHDVWRVYPTDATIIAWGDTYARVLVKQFGKGHFIYDASFQPLMGYGGFAPTMYAYLIYRKSIEWAFESAEMPLPRLSPWPYPYNAAFMVRHDLENYQVEIANIEASAQFEHTNGAKGDYYFCSGTLQHQMYVSYDTNAVVAGLRRAVSNYSASIGPHNGGLKNPNNPSLVLGSYDYWHWGPDEALDVVPSGYPSGKAYALDSVSNAFWSIESWLPGLMTNGFRVWVSPYFNSTREDSLEVLGQLNVKAAGEQKLGPFPHWTVSTKTSGKRHAFVNQPVTDWFVNGLVAQSLEPWHSPGIHTTNTLRAAVDFYYNIGGLVNMYSHTLSHGQGPAGGLASEYVVYSLNTNLHPRLWSANAIDVYNWWLQRSNVQVGASFATNLGQTVAALSISGATHDQTAVEVLITANSGYTGLQVLTNGTQAGSSDFRVVGSAVRVRVGVSITNVVVSYYPIVPLVPVFPEDFDQVSAPALPSGWTTSASGAQSPWITQGNQVDTAPWSAYSPDPANIGINELVSPPITLPSGNARLAFRNSYNLEAAAPGGYGWDGGVLELKIGGGQYTDILAAGGSFIEGGYNRIIDTAWESPIAGRQAWSGNSGGYITTIVNLPTGAAGQVVQFRWRCGTDNSNGADGWRIDTISLTDNLFAPTLAAQINRSTDELTLLTVTNTATDADVPAKLLTYELVNPPLGAIIDSNGVITWTPNEAEGFATNMLVTIVTDHGTPPLTATNSFSVTVNEVNSPPIVVLPPPTNILEEVLWSTMAAAADPDVPVNALQFGLVSGPGGLAVSSAGLISWTPAEAYGPGNYMVFISVTDTNPAAVNAKSLSVTNSFQITVSEANLPPALPPQTNWFVGDGAVLVVTNTALDPDVPANVLGYTLQVNNVQDGSVLTNALIDANGVITWTPAESQRPGTNLFVTVVTDDGAPPLTSTNSFLVVAAPAVPLPTIQSITLSSNLVIIQWAAVAGQNYRVQYSTDMSLTNWMDIAPDVQATGPVAWITNVNGDSLQRFYRVLRLGTGE